jgi:hypothetical protein
MDEPGRPYRQVPGSPLDLQLGPDGPNVLWPQRWLCSSQLTLVPGEAFGCGWDGILGVLYGRAPQLLRVTSMRPASESTGSSVIQRDRQLAAVNVASSRLYLALMSPPTSGS